MIKHINWLYVLFAVVMIAGSTSCESKGVDKTLPQPTNGSVVTPTPPTTVDGFRVGITMANAGGNNPHEEFKAMVEVGIQHVRLSAYYREPFALHRTITEAWIAHNMGLSVLVDVQPTPWLYPEEPTLEEWTITWDSISRSLPPDAVVSVGNEPNVDFWWPWGENHLDMFWAEARKIAHQHGRTFGGPHISGIWPGAREWLEDFLSRNPPPDILMVHYYYADIYEWMMDLPWDGPVWLAEANLLDATPEEQADHLTSLFNGNWERTYIYDWNAHAGYIIKGSLVQDRLIGIILKEK